MIVLHLVAGNLEGGAAKGAYSLHQELLRQGIDSWIITNSPLKKEYSNVISLSSNVVTRIKNRLMGLLDKYIPYFFYHKHKKMTFSTGLIGLRFYNNLAFKNADIVHLHWINNGFINIRDLAKIEKPIVWTMRDMWPMTGGCHHSLDCNKYENVCACCPQLGSKRNNDLSNFIFKRKKRFLSDKIIVVGISQWISKLANKSDIFKNNEIYTINNSIDTELYFPINKIKAKALLNIKTSKKIILIGAQYLNSPYKGLDKFIEALDFLNKDEIFIATFGNLQLNVFHKSGIEHKNFGHISDIESLKVLYSAADVFVAPSIVDTFGKTLVESMSCGTPVVCFDATGPQSIVEHKKTGYKAQPFNSKDLADGIKWIMNHGEYELLAKTSREVAKTRFDVKSTASKYIQLYKKINASK